MPDIKVVNKNLTNKNGLLGALFACPISEEFGTLILRGSIIKNKTHQISMYINT